MSDPLDSPGQSVDEHLPAGGRQVRRRGKRTSRAVEAPLRAGLIQVSAQVPREVLASFDEFSALAGVNRQHLIREALTAYAALLDGGCRVYQVPGVVRSDRAA